jgi:hypothetical protein
VFAAKIIAHGCSGRIVHPANPAFRLKHDSVPEERSFLQHPAENLFGPAAAVDIGMVEEIRTDLLGRIQEFPGLPLVVCRQFGVRNPTSAQAHATQALARYFQISVRDFYHFHRSIF